MASPSVSISVVYALPDRQVVIKLDVAPGTTIAVAVDLSQLQQRWPEIAASPLSCAIYGRVVALTQVVEQGDRIEILRPLLIDPKENRRQVAVQARRKQTR